MEIERQITDENKSDYARQWEMNELQIRARVRNGDEISYFN